MIAVVYALPEESRELVRALEHSGQSFGEEALLGARLGNYAEKEILLFHTGMGEGRVRARFKPFLEAAPEPLSLVISLGFAGGLNPSLRERDLLLSENYSTPAFFKAAEAILKGRLYSGILLSVPAPVESLEEKRALFESSGADAIDMETETLQSLCREKGVPFLSLRVISDSAQQEVPVPFSVCYTDGALQIGALLRYLLRHPAAIRPFIRFSIDAVAARQKLNAAALELIEKLPARL